MSEIEIRDELRRSLVKSWHHYTKALDPLRPDLFRYCRRLTGDVWDAEDLVQDTLERGFSTLSQVMYTLKQPRPYLLRIATNLWIDKLRRREVERKHLAAARETESERPRPSASIAAEVREAASTLLGELAPQERAALLLKEIFGMSLEETADTLGTTVGAVKAALHRGRERLEEVRASGPSERPKPSEAVVQRFVERYNARDLPGLLALMRDTATIEMHGFEAEIGREGFQRERGWFHHNFYSPFDGSPSTARWETAVFAGETIVLVYVFQDGQQLLGSVMRIEDQDGGVSRIRVYAMCPDVIREVAQGLGIPLAPPMGYRFPFDVSGQ